MLQWRTTAPPGSMKFQRLRLELEYALDILANPLPNDRPLVRYGFDWSSNAWLEIQWYMFAAIVMLGAPWVLKLNEHVRVDLIYCKISNRAQVWLDLLGILFFLFPVMILMAWLSWPLFVKMYVSGEMSSNASGLVRWPAMLLLPMGFGLMCLQGLSEVIKRIAHLRGFVTLDAHYEAPLQ